MATSLALPVLALAGATGLNRLTSHSRPQPVKPGKPAVSAKPAATG
ncbi:hypothetical protein HMPREF1978_01545 [Actinomyces graevenitzii F0530]|uniref:Uncharacterized protein n=1 Tax=Actinomyces graevenitzii F0530 TaxID=1321817 RepID=U1PX04_9ACTO|nr:hypothetical protein HMPREF1978_01545 [Actinomyces graevenitzii F0530]